MEWPILAGCVVLAWAMLRIMGNERQRRIYAIQAQIHIDTTKTKQAAETVVEVN